MMGSRGLFGWSPPHMNPLTPVSEISEPPESPSPYPDFTDFPDETDGEFDETEHPPPEAVPFSQLFVCADKVDWLLMGLGSMAAAAHGAALVVYLHYFAKIVALLKHRGTESVEEMYDEFIGICPAPISQVPLCQENSSSTSDSHPSLAGENLDTILSVLPLCLATVGETTDMNSSKPISPHLSPEPNLSQDPLDTTEIVVTEVISDEASDTHEEQSAPTKVPEISSQAAASPDLEDPNDFLNLITKFDPLKFPIPGDTPQSNEATDLIEQLKQLFNIPAHQLTSSQITEVDAIITALLSNTSNLSLEQTGVLMTNQSDITNSLNSLQLVYQEISHDEDVIQGYDNSDSSLSKLTAAFQSRVLESNALEAREQKLMQELAFVREEKQIVKQDLAVRTKEIKQVMDQLQADAATVAILHKDLPLKEIRYKLLLSKWENFKTQMNL